MIKKLFARKELDRLARIELALLQASQHVGGFLNVRPVINYLMKVADGVVSVNVVSDVATQLSADKFRIDHEIRLVCSDLSEAYLQHAKLAEENDDLRRQLTEQTLQADLYKDRYEQANTKHNNLEKLHILLNEKHQSLAKVSTGWYSALYDCAMLMGVEPTAIETTPKRIDEFLSNHNFVFRPRLKVVPDPDFKQTQMHSALADAFTTTNHIMPGIPCNSCVDCECSLDTGCFLSRKAPDVDKSNV